jgi:hypothetical protein
MSTTREEWHRPDLAGTVAGLTMSLEQWLDVPMKRDRPHRTKGLSGAGRQHQQQTQLFRLFRGHSCTVENAREFVHHVHHD